MTFAECYHSHPAILLEGALGERLKREYHLEFHPQVAMAELVRRPEGRRALKELWQGYLAAAEQNGLPFIATTPTRRANRERMSLAGLDEGLIGENLRLLGELRSVSRVPMFIGGLMGCRGDAYSGSQPLSTPQAAEFHAWQAGLFRQAGADFLMAGIMPTLPEAVGMAQAMAATGLPYLISFMIRRDGRLVDGASIDQAIAAIDRDASPRPLCYMVNCVHPTVLYEALSQPFNRTARVRERFHGIQSNTSPLPPEQLDGACELYSSPPGELADAVERLRELVDLRIVGGCCGTDRSHLEEQARRMKLYLMRK